MIHAIDKVGMLCGFKSKKEINDIAKQYPVLIPILHDRTPKEIFDKLYNLRIDVLTSIIYILLSNLKDEEMIFEERKDEIQCLNKKDSPIRLFQMLFKKFFVDRGLIVALCMNYLEIEDSQSLFIPPHVPFCYIFGSFIELSSKSDNSVRLGLSRKFIDLPVAEEYCFFHPYLPSIQDGFYNPMPDKWKMLRLKFDDSHIKEISDQWSILKQDFTKKTYIFIYSLKNQELILFNDTKYQPKTLAIKSDEVIVLKHKFVDLSVNSTWIKMKNELIIVF